MQMNRAVFLMANVVLALCPTGSATQKQEVGGELEIPTAKLVSTMRILGTTEVTYRSENGRFASPILKELLDILRQKNWLGKSPIDLENPEPYQVQITTDLDGTHYQISIKRAIDSGEKSTWCRTAVFEDDAGVIFLGQASDCPAAPH
jgi:hypothetical protein